LFKARTKGKNIALNYQQIILIKFMVTKIDPLWDLWGMRNHHDWFEKNGFVFKGSLHCLLKKETEEKIHRF
jgi:hypothetical protein